MTIDRFAHSALVIVDMQNDFVRVGAPLEVPESRPVPATPTHSCVEETARESFKRGYRTTLLSDAVSAYMPDLHAAALKNVALKFGWVSTPAEVIGALERRDAAPGRWAGSAAA